MAGAVYLSVTSPDFKGKTPVFLKPLKILIGFTALGHASATIAARFSGKIPLPSNHPFQCHTPSALENRSFAYI